MEQPIDSNIPKCDNTRTICKSLQAALTLVALTKPADSSRARLKTLVLHESMVLCCRLVR